MLEEVDKKKFSPSKAKITFKN